MAETPSARTAFIRAFTSMPGNSVETLTVSLSCVTALATRLRSAVVESAERAPLVEKFAAKAFDFFFASPPDAGKLPPSDASASLSAPVSTTSRTEPITSACPRGAGLRGKKPWGASATPNDKTKP